MVRLTCPVCGSKKYGALGKGVFACAKCKFVSKQAEG